MATSFEPAGRNVGPRLIRRQSPRRTAARSTLDLVQRKLHYAADVVAEHRQRIAEYPAVLHMRQRESGSWAASAPRCPAARRARARRGNSRRHCAAAGGTPPCALAVSISVISDSGGLRNLPGVGIDVRDVRLASRPPKPPSSWRPGPPPTGAHPCPVSRSITETSLPMRLAVYRNSPRPSSATPVGSNPPEECGSRAASRIDLADSVRPRIRHVNPRPIRADGNSTRQAAHPHAAANDLVARSTTTNSSVPPHTT